jgi:DNA-binding transcriptional LysR family regulator
MDLRRLRGFVAIVDAGGFARAAAHLNLSQPALSRQIVTLEEELGVKLLDRTRRRVQLTSEGEDLLERSRRLLTDAQAFDERARALKGGDTGVLRLGATPQLIETFLGEFCASYSRRRPGVEIHFVEDGGVTLSDRLARGEVHLTVTAAIGDGRFVERLLMPLYLLVIAPAGHPLARRAAVDITDLSGLPLMVLRRGFGSRQWFDAACEVASVRPRIVLESAAPQTLVSLARARYGMAVVPSNTGIMRGGIRAVPVLLSGVPIGRWAAVMWDPRRFLAPFAERFVNELQARLRVSYPGRDLTRRAPPLPRPIAAAR